MKIAFNACKLLLGAAIVSFCISAGARAQTPVVSPLIEPAITQLPSVPSGAQKSYDPLTVEQLMKMVELTRTIGGGITQLFQTIINQTASLDKIRDAQLGARAIPLNNSPDEVAARQGGEGLKAMANKALSGTALSPQALQDSLNEYRASYSLDKAFAMKDDELQGKAMLALAAAQGAITSSTAENTYRQSNASMARIGGYLSTLESSADLKTSIDLNTRVTLELVQQLNESLRTQATIASMAGTYFMIYGSEDANDNFDLMRAFNR